MPGVGCSVSICKNNFYKQKQKVVAGEQRISFFSFPKNEKLQRIWIKRCRRKDKINIKTARICSAHFKKEDFIDDMYARLTGSIPKLKLKDNVIPTLKLKHDDGARKEEVQSKRSQRSALKERKAMIDNLLANYTREQEKVNPPAVVDVTPPTSEKLNKDVIKPTYEELLEENKKLREKLKENDRELFDAKMKIIEKNKVIKQKDIVIANKILDLFGKDEMLLIVK